MLYIGKEYIYSQTLIIRSQLIHLPQDLASKVREWKYYLKIFLINPFVSASSSG